MHEGSVVIAGAGSAGLAAAIQFAHIGWTVTVLESDTETVYRTHHNWSDAIEFKALARAGFDMPKTEGDTFVGALVKSDDNKNGLFEPHYINPLYIFDPEYTQKTKDPVMFEYVVTDRQALRDAQLEEAKRLGVTVLFEAKATELLGTLGPTLGDIRIEGVKALIDGEEAEFAADLVIDATGAQSALRTMLEAPSIATPFPEEEFNRAYRTVRRYHGSSEHPAFCDHYRYGAYKGYFWVHFHEEGLIDIGGGVSSGGVHPKEVVEQMVSSFGCLGEETRGGSGTVHTGFPPDALVASGFAVLGDAASQVNPSNGCGVGGAILAAIDLAEVVAIAPDTSITSLWPYAYHWYTGRGSDYAALYATTQSLVSLTHADISLLMKKNILGGAMLNYNINGRYPKTSLGSSLRALTLFFGHRELLSSLLASTSGGDKTKKHFEAYPKTWDEAALQQWVASK